MRDPVLPLFWLAQTLALAPVPAAAIPLPEILTEVQGNPVAMMTCVKTLPGGGSVFAGSMEQGAKIAGVDLAPPQGSFGGHFVGRADAAGKVKWIRTVGPAIQVGEGLAIDRTGNIFVGGDYYCGSKVWVVGPDSIDGRDCGNSFYVAKLDSNGNILWARAWPPSGNGSYQDASMEAMAVDGEGSVYVSGWAPEDSLGPPPAGTGPAQFLAKFDSQGGRAWRRRVFCDPCEDDSQPLHSLASLAADQDGNLHAAGSFRGKLRFQRAGSAFDDSLESAGEDDICLFSFTKAGLLRYAKRSGGSDHDAARLLRASGAGLLVAGESAGGFEDPQGAPEGSPAPFLARLDKDGVLHPPVRLTRWENATVAGLDVQDGNSHVLMRADCPLPDQACGFGPWSYPMARLDPQLRILSAVELPEGLFGNVQREDQESIPLSGLSLTAAGVPLVCGSRVTRMPGGQSNRWDAFVVQYADLAWQTGVKRVDAAGSGRVRLSDPGKRRDVLGRKTGGKAYRYNPMPARKTRSDSRLSPGT